MPRDLTFQAIKLLSQRIVSNADKIPEGYIFQATSCMNPEDAELMGLALYLVQRMEKRDEARAKRFRERILPLLEIEGISKWVKGELTHLGFRAGLRYQENIDVAKDGEAGAPTELDEADIVANPDKE